MSDNFDYWWEQQRQANANAGGHTASDSDWYNPGSWGDEKKWWNSDPAAFKYAEGGPSQFWMDEANRSRAMARDEQNAKFIGGARGQAGMSRDQYIAAMRDIQARAQGQNSIVSEQARLAQQQANAGIMSTLASQRGGYSPAAMRAAIMQRGDVGAQLGGQAMLARLQEQQNAQQNYMAGMQALMGRDMSALQQEQQYGLGRGQQQFNWHEMARGYTGMGMDDKQREWAARMMYEEAKKSSYMGTQTENKWDWLKQAGGTAVGYVTGGPAGAKIGNDIGKSL